MKLEQTIVCSGRLECAAGKLKPEVAVDLGDEEFIKAGRAW